jgi:predicted nucleotide-binding protein
MNECGAAIIIFTADEEFKDVNGQTIFRPSENAIFELGAASALYGSRVVIFKEAGVTFPTNFRDIGYIEFDKDRLDAKVSELFRELIAFKLITVSVAMIA